MNYLKYYIWFTAGIVIGMAIRDWLELLIK